MTLRHDRSQPETEPWVLTRQGYETMLRGLQSGGGLLDFKARAAGLDPKAVLDSESNRLVDVSPSGVAVIPIAGFLTARAYWRGDRASYEWIGAQLRSALRDPMVSRIVLNVDSPGGQVAGTDALAAEIFDARESKPVHAFVQGQSASAAYWLTSAAEEVFAGRTSMLGSIGVIWTFTDWSEYDANVGIKEIDIVSSQSPDKAVDPTTRTGRAKIQATVDQLAGVFVADVARNRGVSEATVVSDFGQGWVLVGEAAVAAGLADGISTFENVVAGDPVTGGPRGGIDEPEDGQEADSMDKVALSDITAKWLEEHCPDAVIALRVDYVASSQMEQRLSEATAELQTQLDEALAGGETSATAAVEAERTRVLGIQTAARGMGLGKLVAELVADATVTLDAAKARLFEAVQAKRVGAVDALAGDEDALDAPDAGTDDDEQASSDKDMLRAATQAAGDSVFGARVASGS